MQFLVDWSNFSFWNHKNHKRKSFSFLAGNAITRIRASTPSYAIATHWMVKFWEENGQWAFHSHPYQVHIWNGSRFINRTPWLVIISPWCAIQKNRTFYFNGHCFFLCRDNGHSSGFVCHCCRSNDQYLFSVWMANRCEASDWEKYKRRR